MIKVELPAALNVELKHYAKMHRIDVEDAIIKILEIYLRGANND